MLIITIGRNPDNKIVVNDPTGKVGREHAEIRIQHNGYMTLRDNNSTNGTLVRGQRLTPGQETQVNRGDEVVLAGVQRLDWNQVPTPPDFSKYQKVYTVGRERDNHFLMPDNRISRYHAVVLQDKSGKVFLYDQSSTGTTVNGQRIPSNIAVPVKKGDMVMFGNAQQLDWSRLEGGGSGVARKLLWIIPVLILLAGIGYYAFTLLNKPDPSAMIKEKRKCIGLVVNEYYYEVYSGEELKFLVSKDNNGRLAAYPPENQNFKKITITGSGFFVSKEQVATNRHVILPWKEEEKEVAKELKDLLKMAANSDYRIRKGLENLALLTNMSYDDLLEAADDNFRIEAKCYKRGIIPDGKGIGSLLEFKNGTEWFTEDAQEDMGVLELQKEISDELDYIRLEDMIDDFKAKNEVYESQELVMVGYPRGFVIAFDEIEKTINATSTYGHVSKISSNDIQYDLGSTFGASGSPVFDYNGKLVAINYSGYNTQTGNYNLGVPASKFKRKFKNIKY